MKNKIIVIGSSNTDMIIKSPRIPKPGETILGGVFTTVAGGKGANQAVAAARVGGNVTFICKLGDDILGDQSFANFQQENINVDAIKRENNCASGVALILVDDHGENSISVAPGANGTLTPQDLVDFQPIIASSDIMIIQLEIPIETVAKAIELGDKSNVKIILNPAPAQVLDDKLLSKVSILTPNETEAELLTGMPVNDEKSAIRAAEFLLGKGVQTVILTMGSKGALVTDKNGSTLHKGFKVTAIDTTAAGDIFNGVLGVSISEGKEIGTAVKYANAASALAVTKLGAQPSAPTKDEIDNFLNEITNNK